MRTAGAVERVRSSLAALGVQAEVREFEASTATAAEAAAAIGTSVGRIVKSLVFLAGDAPIVVLASGPNRVDTRKLDQLLGRPVRRAQAEQVRAATGFAIGSVPPVGHTRVLPVYVDRDLLDYDLVWAAAGSSNAVFQIEPHQLVRISGGQVVDLKQDAA